MVNETNPTEAYSLIDSIKGLLFMNQYVLDIKALTDFMNLSIQKLPRKQPEDSIVSNANEDIIVSMVNPYVLSLQNLVERGNINPDQQLTVRDLVIYLTVATQRWGDALDYQMRGIRESIQSAYVSLGDTIRETNQKCDEIAQTVHTV